MLIFDVKQTCLRRRMPRMPSSSQHEAVHPDRVNINVVFSWDLLRHIHFTLLLVCWTNTLNDHEIQHHFEKVLEAFVEAKGIEAFYFGPWNAITGFLIFAKRMIDFKKKEIEILQI